MADPVRTFRPGEEWAYFKVYCGETTAERLLRSSVASLVDRLERDGAITHWFFVRYADPSHHLRLRFHLAGDRWQALLASVNESLADATRDGLVWNVQVDSYDRELERYGPDAIEASERLFHRDSRMVLGALRVVHEAEDEDLRWQFALLAMERLLADFQYDGSRRFDLVDRLARAMLDEFEDPKTLRAGIERKFRDRKALIERVLGPGGAARGRLGELAALIDARSQATDAERRHVLATGDRLSVPLDLLLSTHLHMFCNRLFPSRQRLHELVMYWFLAKHLRSEAARRSLTA